MDKVTNKIEFRRYHISQHRNNSLVEYHHFILGA